MTSLRRYLRKAAATAMPAANATPNHQQARAPVQRSCAGRGRLTCRCSTLTARHSRIFRLDGFANVEPGLRRRPRAVVGNHIKQGGVAAMSQAHHTVSLLCRQCGNNARIVEHLEIGRVTSTTDNHDDFTLGTVHRVRNGH